MDTNELIKISNTLSDDIVGGGTLTKFDLENKITYDELSPSLQAMFGILQAQITQNQQKIDALEDKVGSLENKVDDLQSVVNYLNSIRNEVEYLGERNGYPMLKRTICTKDGKEYIEQWFTEKNTVSGSREEAFTYTFPVPMDRVVGVYYFRASSSSGWTDGWDYVRREEINGSGMNVQYDSCHEHNRSTTLIRWYYVFGYKLTGEAPDLPSIGGDGGDTGDSSTTDEKIANLVPIGTIRFSYNIPSGWLECNGQYVVKTDYPDLYQFAVDNNLIVSDSEYNAGHFGKFSTGTNTNTFRLPDFRAMFIRGYDHGRGMDTNRQLFIYQEDASAGGGIDDIDLLVRTLNACVAVRSNNQVGGANNYVSNLPTIAESWEYFQKSEGNRHAYYRDQFAQIPGSVAPQNLESRAKANETRPKNIDMYVIIRAK